MRGSGSIGLVLGCALAACSGNPPATAPATSPPAATASPAAPDGTRGANKPGAPIELTMDARPVAGTADVDRFAVRLTATPRRDVERVELSIDGRPSQIAAATAGTSSEVLATIDVAKGQGKDVIGTAVLVVDGKRMGSATQIRVGAAAPDPASGTIIHLPDGTPVQEVRP